MDDFRQEIARLKDEFCWHDIREEPKGVRNILLEDDYGLFEVIQSDTKSWLAAMCDPDFAPVRWCYLPSHETETLRAPALVASN